jgi:hypothetical protein
MDPTLRILRVNAFIVAGLTTDIRVMPAARQKPTEATRPSSSASIDVWGLQLIHRAPLALPPVFQVSKKAAPLANAALIALTE